MAIAQTIENAKVSVLANMYPKDSDKFPASSYLLFAAFKKSRLFSGYSNSKNANTCISFLVYSIGRSVESFSRFGH